MSKKYLFTSVFAGAGIIALAFVMNYVAAQSESVSGSGTGPEIQYPVKELGNCINEAACRTYCDKSANAEACLNFAKENNLMPVEEIERAQKFLNAGAGPGGCKTKDTCESYCDSVERIDECVAFAEKNDLMPPQQLEEAKKIQAAKARGVKMPACGGKKQCDAYCSEPDHMEECITFAQEAGFMQPKELEESKKILAAIKAGAKPPSCKGKEECDIYCSQEEHFDSCLEFALAAGMMDPKEAEMAKKTKGKGPGGCRGKEQCDSFCQQEGNMETCAQFAYDNGMMTKEEFEMMKKTGGKGPGGCKSKEECQSFCDNPDNQETCMNFAKENGLIPEADLKRMEQGKQQFKESMQSVPPEVLSCLDSAVGAETMAKFKNGEAMPPRDIGDKMRVCFEQNIKPPKPGEPGEGGSMPPAGGGPGNPPTGKGPGGCASQEECQKYCESNQEACKNFQSPAQPMPGGTPGSRPTPCQGENCPPPGSGGPGSGFMGAPCEGENCQPPPPSGQQYQSPPSGGGPVPAPMQCEGGNCQPPPGEQQYQQPQQQMQPGMQEGGPSGGAPGTPPAGGLPPGEYAPPAPPSGETTPSPSAPPPPTSSGNLDSLLGAIFNPFIEFLFGN